ncbi:pilus assembly FimT family protein [Acidisoma sp. 7E03]
MTSRSNAQAGFTLLEMLVTVAVMGIVLAVLAGVTRPQSHRLELQAAAREVARAMRLARGAAMVGGAPVSLALPRLAPWLTVVEQPSVGGIVFTPDGASSGGTVLLAGAGLSAAVHADWLTGRVDIDGAR